ncbi:unnamed protein product [Boreogadus saida]
MIRPSLDPADTLLLEAVLGQLQTFQKGPTLYLVFAAAGLCMSPVSPEAVRVPAPEFPESPISPEAVQGSH